MKTLKKCLHYVKLLPLIADAGKAGIRTNTLSDLSGIPYPHVGVWLEVQKRPGGMVLTNVKNHTYTLSPQGRAILKTLPPPNTVLAPIILRAVKSAGLKGLTSKAISEKTNLPPYICTAWLNNNKDKVDPLAGGRYGVAKPKPVPPKVVPPKTTPKSKAKTPLPAKPPVVSKTSLYNQHKKLVSRIIDKVKGNARLKRNTLIALRTAVHAKRDKSPLYVMRDGVLVVRTIYVKNIVYEIYIIQHLQQLSHKAKEPAFFPRDAASQPAKLVFTSIFGEKFII